MSRPTLYFRIYLSLHEGLIKENFDDVMNLFVNHKQESNDERVKVSYDST